jgi:hypothetical protein
MQRRTVSFGNGSVALLVSDLHMHACSSPTDIQQIPYCRVNHAERDEVLILLNQFRVACI